ncbi:hypothetical protein Gohar_013781, partial [Gossypium harknessii]|nr:hypothetical protein [Gossypium harknessii]
KNRGDGPRDDVDRATKKVIIRRRRWLLVREVMTMASGEGSDDDIEFQE